MTKAKPLTKQTMSTFADPTSASLDPTDRTSAPLLQIVANPDNPRGEVADVSDLVAGFRRDGQIQPITVVEATRYLEACAEFSDVVGDAVYVAVTGARRLAAARQLGWTSIDVVVKNQFAETRSRAYMAAFLENFQREDLTPSATAKAVKRFVDEGMQKGDVAAALGMSNPWVTREYRIANLSPELLVEYDAGRMTKEDGDVVGRRRHPEQGEAWGVLRAARHAGDKRKAAEVLAGPPPPDAPSISRREIPEDEPSETVQDTSSISRREIDGSPDTVATADAKVVTEVEPVTETMVSSNGHDTGGPVNRVQPYRQKKAEPAGESLTVEFRRLVGELPGDRAERLVDMILDLDDDVVARIRFLLLEG